ncbi:NYN domain-containing protein [Frigidibacter oleivorans]|uniref:NYN domain-containing protein n=1 Tax=Frigidibacter oleivorans TaxID=2487129 RepID=UPI000F8C446B|nr:hypothetical protein [Frigidibacter oleivorans]
MTTPLILLGLSLAALAAAVAIPGLSDLVLLAAPSALASLWLLLRAALGKDRRKWIVVDGSNVMHWKDNTPRIETLREVLARLIRHGYTPGVVFDANAGYLISGRYLDDGALARMLDLPADRVLVVPKGSPADPVVLATARDLGARIVSNDRFRDWAEGHPELQEPGWVVRGDYRDGTLRMDLG